jgi:hypothetical protein
MKIDICVSAQTTKLTNVVVSNTSMKGIKFLYDSRTGNTGMNREQLSNLNRLYDIKQLDEDWNGYGGHKINPTAIEISEAIVKGVSVQPIIYPTGRSSIQMQYELETDGSYLEFEVFETEIMCMLVPKRIYENTIFEKITCDNIRRVNQIVEEFYGR